MDTAHGVFFLCLSIGLSALVLVLVKLFNVWQFAGRVKLLPQQSLDDIRDFRGDLELVNPVNSFLAALRRAIKRNSLAHFNVDQRLQVLRASANASTAWPRALAGLLILGSLLVTLLNLQTSVNQLGLAFQPRREVSASETTGTPPRASAGSPRTSEINLNADSNQNAELQQKRIQELQAGMAAVAESARSAFQSSGWILLMATFILGANLYSSVTIAKATGAFSRWAHDAYDEAWSVTAAGDPTAALTTVATVLTDIAKVVERLESSTEALSGLGDFGNKLELSTQAVADAIAKLPDSVGTAVSGIGGEVGRFISEDLKHQLEFLKKIVAIYGDQELHIQELQKFLKQSAQSSETAAGALRKLPEQISELRQGITAHRSSTDELTKRLEQLARNVVNLDAKVDALPIFDLKRASDDLGSAINGLTESGAVIASAGSQLAEFLRSWKPAIQQELGAGLAAVSRDIQKASEDLDKRLTGNIQGIYPELKAFGDKTSRLVAAVELVQSEVRSRGKEVDEQSRRIESTVTQVNEKLDYLAQSARELDKSAHHSIWGRIFNRERGKGAGE